MVCCIAVAVVVAWDIANCDIRDDHDDDDVVVIVVTVVVVACDHAVAWLAHCSQQDLYGSFH